MLITASSFQNLYPTAADRADFAATIAGNGTYTAIYGPARALDTIGGMTAWRTGSTLAVIIALMNVLLIGRHTRAEEERGRTELVRAGAVGAREPLAAALAVVVAMDLAIAVIVALGLIAMGLPAAGSIALGASLGRERDRVRRRRRRRGPADRGRPGRERARGHRPRGRVPLRAAGDSSDGTLSWLSPLGWAHATRPFADERWWPLLLCLAGRRRPRRAARSRCSPGATSAPGCCPTRPATGATPRLRTSLGLAFRLQRGGLMAWSVGMFLGGLVIGSIGTDARRPRRQSQSRRRHAQRARAASIVDAFFASVFLLMAMIASGFTISSALRLRGEESAGHTELLLSTPVARLRWAGGHC